MASVAQFTALPTNRYLTDLNYDLLQQQRS